MMPENNGIEKSTRISNLLAISILALAASLTYFTFELSQFIRQIPDILENVRITSEKIEPVLDEVGQIRDLMQPALLEVNAIREQIPSLLKEAENIRKAIPPILGETAAIRKQLPSVLASADKASASIKLFTSEMKAYQPIATEALAQIEATRKEIPIILDRTEKLIDRAHMAARDASSGAMTGAIGGLLTAPFRLVGSFANSVLDLSKSEADDYSRKDIANIQKHTLKLLQNGNLNDTESWTNPDTQHRAELTLQKTFQDNGRECRQILIKSWLKSKLTLEKEIIACLNDKNEWENKD